MNDRNHIRSHSIKLSKNWADWGFKTLCGHKVKYAPTKPQQGVCSKCLRVFLLKKENEIENLKLLETT